MTESPSSEKPRSHSLQGSHVSRLYSHFSLGVVFMCAPAYCVYALFSWGAEKWFMGIHLIQIGELPQSKAIKTFKTGVMHIFLNFLTLSVILCCLFVSVSMSEAVRLSQWQLVIHFSSSVPCILIRANSLVSLTQVSLRHWSDPLPGCTLTSACPGNYYYSPHFMHKHTV